MLCWHCTGGASWLLKHFRQAEWPSQEAAGSVAAAGEAIRLVWGSQGAGRNFAAERTRLTVFASSSSRTHPARKEEAFHNYLEVVWFGSCKLLTGVSLGLHQHET